MAPSGAFRLLPTLMGSYVRAVPKENLMAEAMEWAEYMCTLGQPSVRAHKQMLYRGRNMSTHGPYGKISCSSQRP